VTDPSQQETPTFSICIPSYNSAEIIAETLESVLCQTFDDFELVVVDDCSADATEAVVRSYGDRRITFHRNDRNLGYARNIARCCALASGRFIYLLGNDDVLSPVALERALAAFDMDPDVALVTRPYYWFAENDLDAPVRVVPPLDPRCDLVVSVDDGDVAFRAVIDSLGQLSGLAFRRDAFVPQFAPHVFTAHVRPFLETWKTHKAVFLKDYVVAVRIASSQTRNVAGIYEPSPAWSWIAMFDEVFGDERFAGQRAAGRAVIASHVEGLVQIRCYAGFVPFWREITILVRYHPANLLSWKFWMFAVGLAILPPRLSRTIVDRFKPHWTDARGLRIRLAKRPATYPSSSSANIVACRSAAAANE
jgi:glycosyltransferase involved in cell wall biosynthesis